MIPHEPVIRLGAFLLGLAALALWEWAAPRRVQVIGRHRRWPGNLALVALNTMVIRVIFPIATIGVALIAEERARTGRRAVEV